MPRLRKNIGAPHPTRRSVPVYRGGAWTIDTVVDKDDVFPADDEEVLRYAYKLKPVPEAAYPPIPGDSDGAGEAEAEATVRRPSAPRADTTADAEPALASIPTALDEPDVVDVDLYYDEGTDRYELPNGTSVKTRAKALKALGVEESEDWPDGSD